MSEKLREAARQALEALENATIPIDSIQMEAENAAIAALRSVLEEPEPVQEPVAWMWEETASRTSTGISGVDRKLLFCRPVDEPWKRNITPLYTHPPQREPLTNEEINVLFSEALKGDKSAHWLCRAIERKLRGEKE